MWRFHSGGKMKKQKEKSVGYKISIVVVILIILILLGLLTGAIKLDSNSYNLYEKKCHIEEKINGTREVNGIIPFPINDAPANFYCRAEIVKFTSRQHPEINIPEKCEITLINETYVNLNTSRTVILDNGVNKTITIDESYKLYNYLIETTIPVRINVTVCNQVQIKEIMFPFICANRHCGIVMTSRDLDNNLLNNNCVCNSIHATWKKRQTDFIEGIRSFNKDSYDQENVSIIMMNNLGDAEEFFDRTNGTDIRGGADNHYWSCSKWTCGSYEVSKI